MTPDMRAIVAEIKQGVANGGKHPGPTMGVSPSWLWWSRKWLQRRKDIMENTEPHYLHDFIWEALAGYTTRTEITRGYPSREAAFAALAAVIRTLEFDDITRIAP